MRPATPAAAILGVSGSALTAAEAALVRRRRPLGAILFARNVVDPAQVRALTDALREELGDDAPILVDQEGGRVARLRPPHWAAHPPAAAFEGGPEARAAANAALIGAACSAVGLDVVCAPCLDLRLPGAHDVVGDRAFSADPREVARLGAAWAEGLRWAGCVPVVKHIPGHGRATTDSHHALPRVSAGLDDLAADLAPFAALCRADRGRDLWAMTAHIVYDALDPRRPATVSPRVIGEVIRGVVGFEGPLVSDDLAMRALTGDPGGLARAALAAGCDLVLHCTGRLEDNEALLAACPPLSDRAAERVARARAATRRPPLSSAPALAAAA